MIRGFKEKFERTVHGGGVIARFRFGFPYPDGPRTILVQMASFRYRGEVLCAIITGDA